jgi:hypothetical protein
MEIRICSQSGELIMQKLNTLKKRKKLHQKVGFRGLFGKSIAKFCSNVRIYGCTITTMMLQISSCKNQAHSSITMIGFIKFAWFS